MKLNLRQGLALVLAVIALLALLVVFTTPDRSGEVPESAAPQNADAASAPVDEMLDPDGVYTTKEDVALYIHQYGHLPENFITKRDAEKLGWTSARWSPTPPENASAAAASATTRGCCLQRPDAPTPNATLTHSASPAAARSGSCSPTTD